MITVAYSRTYVNPGDPKPWEPYGPDLMHRYNELGYDQVVFGSTWASRTNAYQAVRFGQDQLPEERVKGFLMGTWMHTKDAARYAMLDGAHRLYIARKKWYPDTL